jgi:serine/threonine-protein kinase RsbW
VLNRSIQFPSLRANIRNVETFLIGLCDELHINADLMDRIMISVTEAVNNAIIHGNKSDPTKMVELSCACDGQWLRFCVRDEGPGFVPDTIPDPRFSDNLLKEGGRGVLIIRAFMDSVEFRRLETGMEVCLGLRIQQ